MPGSARENDHFVRTWVDYHKVKTVLDMGAGKGTYSDLLRDLVDTIDAVEIWQPYIDEFDLHAKYDTVYNNDIRGFTTGGNHYDLVIFGDVLEHMTEEEALYTWSFVPDYASAGMISVPIIHYPQGAEFNNPYEVHVQEHLTPEHVQETYGPFDDFAVYDITGTFFRRF